MLNKNSKEAKRRGENACLVFINRMIRVFDYVKEGVWEVWLLFYQEYSLKK